MSESTETCPMCEGVEGFWCSACSDRGVTPADRPLEGQCPPGCREAVGHGHVGPYAVPWRTRATSEERVEAVRALAWDEGCAAGRSRWMSDHDDGQYPPVNPYLAALTPTTKGGE